MPQYDLHAVCSECGATHPMRIRVYLDEGPLEKRSVAETFEGKPLPPQISAIEGHQALCLKTGRTFVQENAGRIFLVRTS